MDVGAVVQALEHSVDLFIVRFGNDVEEGYTIKVSDLDRIAEGLFYADLYLDGTYMPCGYWYFDSNARICEAWLDIQPVGCGHMAVLTLKSKACDEVLASGEYLIKFSNSCDGCAGEVRPV